MSVRLDQIVPWGRSFDEYRLMFRLTGRELGQTILGCGDGPASFNAELTRLGGRVVSCDPIYLFDGPQIRSRFEASTDAIISQVRQNPQNYVWTYHRDPDDLLRSRRTVIYTFLADYALGRRDGRYVAGALPNLPFADQQFDLAVCSHLLFLYSDLLSLEFHLASVDELCRVAREVRIFPLTALDCEPSRHVEAVRTHAQTAQRQAEIVAVNYQLQRNGNQMMRIWR
jgi:hypothetical protein